MVAALLDDLLAIAFFEFGDLVFVGWGQQADVVDKVFAEHAAHCEVLVHLHNVEALQLSLGHGSVGLCIFGEWGVPAVELTLMPLSCIIFHITYEDVALIRNDNAQALPLRIHKRTLLYAIPHLNQHRSHFHRPLTHEFIVIL